MAGSAKKKSTKKASKKDAAKKGSKKAKDGAAKGSKKKGSAKKSSAKKSPAKKAAKNRAASASKAKPKPKPKSKSKASAGAKAEASSDASDASAASDTSAPPPVPKSKRRAASSETSDESVTTRHLKKRSLSTWTTLPTARSASNGSGEQSDSFDEYDNDYFRVDEDDVKSVLIEADRLRHRGKAKEALKKLLAASRENPGEAQVLDELGQTYMILGRYDDAWDAFTEAVRHNPSFLVYGHRAQCELEMGQYTPALHDFDTAIDLVCDDSRATNAIFNELKTGRRRALRLAQEAWQESSASDASESSG